MIGITDDLETMVCTTFSTVFLDQEMTFRYPTAAPNRPSVQRMNGHPLTVEGQPFNGWPFNVLCHRRHRIVHNHQLLPNLHPVTNSFPVETWALAMIQSICWPNWELYRWLSLSIRLLDVDTSDAGWSEVEEANNDYNYQGTKDYDPNAKPKPNSGCNTADCEYDYGDCQSDWSI